MVYRDLIGKQIGLIGTDKICSDIQEFFSELSYEQVRVVEDDVITVANLSKFEKCDVLVVAVEKEKVGSDIFESIQIPVITLTDLFEMVDELETFYIDKMRNDKTICVFGNDEHISGLVTANPNLRITYILTEDGEKHTDSTDQYESISMDQLREAASTFLIIADDVRESIKKRFIELGMEFGKEFHFYNSRVPKNPTSYYLRKTMLDAPKYTIPCDYTKKALSIKAHGNVMACCSSVGLSLGNSLYTSIEEILRGIQAQLICLSVNNRTYSFCGDMCFMFREKKYRLENEEDIKKNPRRNISLRHIKDFNVQLGYDRSCNLACPSCRDHRITKPEDSQEVVVMMHDEVKRMCLKKPRNMRIGNGELFFSPYYKDIIFK